MIIKIINKSNNPLPRYESAQAAGMDIRCHLAEPITLLPLERKLIPTGLFIELPVGYEAQIRQNVAWRCQGRSGDKRSQKNIHWFNAG